MYGVIEMSDNYVYIDSKPDPRKNLNRYWLTKKGRDVGTSADLDREIESWVWSNTDYHRGQIIVNTIIGYTWGKYPGTPEGLERMRCELGGRKIWETYEDGDDFHIVLWGEVRDKQPKQAYCKPRYTASKNARGRLLARKSAVRGGRR